MVDSVFLYGCFVVFCFNSFGVDDYICVVFYFVFVEVDGIVYKLVSKFYGEGYITGDLWKFEKFGNIIVVIGLKGFCCYVVLFNNEYKD